MLCVCPWAVFAILGKRVGFEIRSGINAHLHQGSDPLWGETHIMFPGASAFLHIWSNCAWRGKTSFVCVLGSLLGECTFTCMPVFLRRGSAHLHVLFGSLTSQ